MILYIIGTIVIIVGLALLHRQGVHTHYLLNELGTIIGELLDETENKKRNADDQR